MSKSNRNKNKKNTMTARNNTKKYSSPKHRPTTPVTATKDKTSEPAKPKGMSHDKSLMLAVFAIQNPSRNRACNDHAMAEIIRLAPEGCTVVKNKGNLLIRKGDASGPHPHFLAHMDQVHDYAPFMQVIISGNVMHAVDGNNEQHGIGGDDKCGIYLALTMLRTLPHVTAVFVRDEEVGCLGSAVVPLEWFDHASFVIQADRNNSTMDVIRDTNSMNCATDEFMEAILQLPITKAAGHSDAYGSITDIGELAERGLPISMINISSGYHHAHTSREVVHLDELGIACQLAYEAATTMGSVVWGNAPESAYFGGGGSVSHYGCSDNYWKSGGYGGNHGQAGGWSTEQESVQSQRLIPSTEGGGMLSAEEAAFEREMYMEGVEDALENNRREGLIGALVSEYGMDRDFDVLDQFDTEGLEEMLEDRDMAAPREA